MGRDRRRRRLGDVWLSLGPLRQVGRAGWWLDFMLGERLIVHERIPACRVGRFIRIQLVVLLDLPQLRVLLEPVPLLMLRGKLLLGTEVLRLRLNDWVGRRHALDRYLRAPPDRA